MFIISPFRFNAWKHHLHWVKQRISTFRDNQDIKLREDAIEHIKSINSNHIDVYTGFLKPPQIIRAIDDQLKLLLVTNRKEFVSLLNTRDFYLITLQDDSVWVLRAGTEEKLHIHLHPARNSCNAVRIHGNTWKTAVLLKMFYSNPENIGLPGINDIRIKYLGLSPIKDMESSQRLVSALKLLDQ